MEDMEFDKFIRPLESNLECKYNAGEIDRRVCCINSEKRCWNVAGWKESQQKKKDAAAKRKADDGKSKSPGGKKANEGDADEETNKENQDEDDEVQEVAAES